MQCERIWDLTRVYLQQKLAIEVPALKSLLVSGRDSLLKIPTLPGIESETAAYNAVTLPLHHGIDLGQKYL